MPFTARARPLVRSLAVNGRRAFFLHALLLEDVARRRARQVTPMRIMKHPLLSKTTLFATLAVLVVAGTFQASALAVDPAEAAEEFPLLPEALDHVHDLVAEDDVQAGFAAAAFPVESINDRGADVRAAQYLLTYRGYSVTIDGVFSSTMQSKVKSFQSANGLTADGIIGANTWTKLAPTVKRGDSNYAVRALQYQLNAKHSYGLAVDGVFGAGTESAVKNFQSHAGITADGIVGATTWRNLIWHFMQPTDTSNLCRITPYTETWGTGDAVGLLQHASNLFGGLGYGKLASNDISYQHGGDHPDHATHEKGMDVDIRLIRTDKAQCSYGCEISQSCYWRAGTQTLCNKLREAAPGHVAAIYFNDQSVINSGCSSYVSGHHNHIHISYK
jgi:hypothetical protein